MRFVLIWSFSVTKVIKIVFIWSIIFFSYCRRDIQWLQLFSSSSFLRIALVEGISAEITFTGPAAGGL